MPLKPITMGIKVNKSIRTAPAYTLAEKCDKELQELILENDPFLTQECSEFHTEVLEYSEVLNQGKLKSVLAMLDDNRDRAALGVYGCVESARYLPSEAIQSACSALQEILDRYPKSKLSKSMDFESTMLTSMIDDLSSDNLDSARASLPLFERHLNHLKETCAKFKSTQQAWLHFKSDLALLNNSTVLKGKILSRLNKRILPYIETMMMVRPDVYGECFTHLDQIVKAANAKIGMKKENVGDPISA